MAIKIGNYTYSSSTIKRLEMIDAKQGELECEMYERRARESMISDILKIKGLIEEKLGKADAYIHLSGTLGKILVRIYNHRSEVIQLFYNTYLLEELGVEGFADMVVLDVTFS